MNLKFTLILGAGIIFSFIAIFIAVFSAFRGPEKEVLISKTDFRGDSIQQRRFLNPLPQQEGEQGSTKLESPPILKKVSQPPKSGKKLTTTDSLIKKTGAVISKEKSGVTAPIPSEQEKPSQPKEEPTQISKEDGASAKIMQMKMFETQMPEIIKELLATVPASTSTPLSEQEIFKQLWPQEYLENLRLLEDQMIRDGFKNADDRNPFATNQNVFNFLDSATAYLFSKKQITADELQNIQKALSLTLLITQSPLFNFTMQQELEAPTE